MQVSVRDNNVDQALRALKKKLQREGVFREMKLKQHFEKPSEKKAREKAEAIRRARKLARKRHSAKGCCKLLTLGRGNPADQTTPERRPGGLSFSDHHNYVGGFPLAAGRHSFAVQAGYETDFTKGSLR